MNLEIFKHGIKFGCWGEIYAGLKEGYIGKKAVFEILQSDNILFQCNDDQLVKLYLADEDSMWPFYAVISQFIIDDGDIPIAEHKEETEYPFNYVPFEYWKIWILELLLRIDAENISVEDKVDKAYYTVYAGFDYPKELSELTIFFAPGKGRTTEAIFSSMNKYIGELIEYFRVINVEAKKKRRI